MDAATGSLVVSTIAVAVSILSAWKAHRVGAVQASAQARLAALEEARERSRLRERRSANLTAEVIRGRRDELVIHNTGPAGARDVRVQLDGGPLLAHAWVWRNQTEVTALAPGAQVAYLLGLSHDTPDVAEVEITWIDDSGESGRWSSQLRGF